MIFDLGVLAHIPKKETATSMQFGDVSYHFHDFSVPFSAVKPHFHVFEMLFHFNGGRAKLFVVLSRGVCYSGDKKELI